MRLLDICVHQYRMCKFQYVPYIAYATWSEIRSMCSSPTGPGLVGRCMSAVQAASGSFALTKC